MRPIVLGLKKAQDAMLNMVLKKSLSASAPWSEHNIVSETTSALGKRTLEIESGQFGQVEDFVSGSTERPASNDLVRNSSNGRAIKAIRLPADSEDWALVDVDMCDLPSEILNPYAWNSQGLYPSFLVNDETEVGGSWLIEPFITFNEEQLYVFFMFYHIEENLQLNKWVLRELAPTKEQLDQLNELNGSFWRGDIFILKFNREEQE